MNRSTNPGVDLLGSKLQRAVVLHQQGELSNARRLYEEILRVQPRHCDALHLLGVVAAASGDPKTAVELIANALEIDPRREAAHNNLGAALRELGHWQAALSAFERAIALKASYPEPHYNRANVYADLRQWEAALIGYDRAIELRTDYREAHFKRGNVLCRLLRWEEAKGAYDRALSLNPEHAEAYANRGFVLHELRRLEDALADSDKAIALDPQCVEAHGNRGTLLLSMQRMDDALASYDRALTINPDYASGHVNRALALLSIGAYERGWADYQWRWRDGNSWVIHERRDFDQPLWLGEEPLAGKTMLLHSEQGYGDTLQFCRYAPLLADMGATVVLEVPRALAILCTSLHGVQRVVVHGETLPPFDVYCPLLSLPLALRTTLNTVPARVPYLAATAERRGLWRDRLGPRARPRVGLAWSGGFRAGRPELWSTNARRNVPLASLETLAHPGIEFVCLQQDAAAQAELTQLTADGWRGPAMRIFAGDLTDFEDTAALIEHLDLVIAVDTAVAHLAGALSRPVWILNRFDACWRWLRDRDDSPWYPTARLYRQDRAGDWDGLLHTVRRDLSDWVDSR